MFRSEALRRGTRVFLVLAIGATSAGLALGQPTDETGKVLDGVNQIIIGIGFVFLVLASVFLVRLFSRLRQVDEKHERDR
jgi:hypothetical protein